MTGTLTTTGTLTANADGTYTDNTTTTGSVNMSLGNDCLTVSSVVVTCEKAALAFSPLGGTATCSSCGEVQLLRSRRPVRRDRLLREQILLTGNYSGWQQADNGRQLRVLRVR